MVYLTEHYPDDGASSVAEALGKPVLQVRDKANKLGLRLTAEATARLVNSQARAYMTANNPMRTPAAKAKMRRWHRSAAGRAVFNALMLGAQAIQRERPSELETKLRSLLEELGVTFEPSYFVKPKFIVDAKIGHLIIQADGEYWHGHPERAPFTERQLKQQRRDRAQDAYLRKCGYTVVRLWERDVNKATLLEVLRRHHAALS